MSTSVAWWTPCTRPGSRDSGSSRRRSWRPRPLCTASSGAGCAARWGGGGAAPRAAPRRPSWPALGGPGFRVLFPSLAAVGTVAVALCARAGPPRRVSPPPSPAPVVGLTPVAGAALKHSLPDQVRGRRLRVLHLRPLPGPVPGNQPGARRVGPVGRAFRALLAGPGDVRTARPSRKAPEPQPHHQPRPHPPGPQAATLARALQHFTAAEVLDGDNRYRAPNGKLVRARKRITIEEAPNVLAVHLKRFDFFGHGGWTGPPFRPPFGRRRRAVWGAPRPSGIEPPGVTLSTGNARPGGAPQSPARPAAPPTRPGPARRARRPQAVQARGVWDRPGLGALHERVAGLRAAAV